MEADILKLQELFKSIGLDYTEEATEQELTWYVDTALTTERKFNFKEIEYYIYLVISNKDTFGKLINDSFLSKLMLNGFNWKNVSFSDSNKQGNITILSFTRVDK